MVKIRRSQDQHFSFKFYMPCVTAEVLQAAQQWF